jgi:arsenate reductase
MSSPRLTIYTLAQCDTCRRAVTWLEKQGISFIERPIRDTPPSKAELKQMLAAQNGEIRRLFNIAGREYRALDLKSKLPALSADQALTLLAGNGSLVKRPFLVGPQIGLVGFDEAAWTRHLATRNAAN